MSAILGLYNFQVLENNHSLFSSSFSSINGLENILSSIIQDKRPNAALVLADGTTFHGRGIGATGTVTAPVVYNTDVMGYQEILTDEAMSGRIVTFAYPHIGNTGVNQEDNRSDVVQAVGIIIRAETPVVSNFRATGDLNTFLKNAGVVGLAEIDTRQLVRHLRDHGPMVGTIISTDAPMTEEMIQKAQAATQVVELQ